MKPTFANLLFLVLACSTMGLGGLWWYKQDKQVGVALPGKCLPGARRVDCASCHEL